ncbi:putative repeat protein (TIGR02543 family) [Paenibacillus anaericanus]|uniref:InlB B-repeat-containing protein n=1 Tax=Paenibacillus anaericanus TaxID=170367 RepID=UPI002782674B|nr:InlB B-repeat-containing protein [Paenibacillus anaericanus]MDQ0091379.1 putative repeat protein (TIGR02543 family) [Paenibacillus anaericanus]
MRKSRAIFMVLLSIFVSVFLLTACGKSDSTMEPGVSNNTDSSKETIEKTLYTVTFYDMDGNTELSKEEVKESESAKEYAPQKDNYIFMGWYGTPSLTHKYDFSTPVTADTKIFAGFLEEKEDTRSFAVVGSGKSPILVTSNWGTVIDDSHILTKEAIENVYSISIDLYEGDEFQLATNTSWYNQRGAGYLTTTSQEGIEYFAGAGSNYQSNEAKRANIKSLKSGNYTLKLTTYPGADVYDTENSNYTDETKEKFNSNPYDTIDWVYNGEPKDAIADVTTSYYIKSSITTNWNDVYEDKYRFKEIDGMPALTIELAEKEEFLFTSTVKTGDTENVGNEYVKFSNIKDKNSLEFVEGSASDNIIAKAAGVYTFTYNPETKELTLTFKVK